MNLERLTPRNVIEFIAVWGAMFVIILTGWGSGGLLTLVGAVLFGFLVLAAFRTFWPENKKER